MTSESAHDCNIVPSSGSLRTVRTRSMYKNPTSRSRRDILKEETSKNCQTAETVKMPDSELSSVDLHGHKKVPSSTGFEVVKPRPMQPIKINVDCAKDWLCSNSDCGLSPHESEFLDGTNAAKKNRKLYENDRIEKAIADIKNGMSARAASMKWGVPRSTLQNRKKGGFHPVFRPGPSTVMTSQEESRMCEWLLDLCRRGIPIRRHFLLDSIQKIVAEDGRQTPFINNRPGKGWFKAFLRRHPNIAERYADSLCRDRTHVTENCILDWFADAERFFKEKNCLFVLNDPTRQYNGDQTEFQLNPRNGRILTSENESSNAEAGGDKQQLTVLVTTRADGERLPTAVVYPYKKTVPREIIENMPEEFVVAHSEGGWMTPEIFYEYMANSFIPSLNGLRRREKNLLPSDELILENDDWVVYWIDGYSSRLTLQVSQICELNYIHLYSFKTHASQVCQPNNVGPFKPLKAEWKSSVAEWKRIHPSQRLTKQEFAPLLAITLSKLSKEAIIAGYQATGLCPWDVNAVSVGNLMSQPSSVPVIPRRKHSYLERDDQKPTLKILRGPHTDGFTVAFCYDDLNNIVITHILPNTAVENIDLSSLADSDIQLSAWHEATQILQPPLASRDVAKYSLPTAEVFAEPLPVSYKPNQLVAASDIGLQPMLTSRVGNQHFMVSDTNRSAVVSHNIKQSNARSDVGQSSTVSDDVRRNSQTVSEMVDAILPASYDGDDCLQYSMSETHPRLSTSVASVVKLSGSPNVILQCMDEIAANIASSPSRSGKRGVGKISLGSDSDIFYPSPTKKAKSGKILPTQLFPDCVSTKNLHGLLKERKPASQIKQKKPSTNETALATLPQDYYNSRAEMMHFGIVPCNPTAANSDLVQTKDEHQ